MKYLIPLGLSILLSGSLAAASFRDGYMSPQDIIRGVSTKFMGLIPSSGVCQVVIDADRSLLGDINPASGDVPNAQPSSSFLSWYDKCLSDYNHTAFVSSSSQSPLDASNNRIVNELLIPNLMGTALSSLDLFTTPPQNKTRQQAAEVLGFEQLSEAQQKEIIRASAHWILGSDPEILAYQRVANLDAYREDLRQFLLQQKFLSLSRAFTILTTTLLKRDEFLLY